MIILFCDINSFKLTFIKTYLLQFFFSRYLFGFWLCLIFPFLFNLISFRFFFFCQFLLVFSYTCTFLFSIKFQMNFCTTNTVWFLFIYFMSKILFYPLEYHKKHTTTTNRRDKYARSPFKVELLQKRDDDDG